MQHFLTILLDDRTFARLWRLQPSEILTPAVRKPVRVNHYLNAHHAEISEFLYLAWP